MPKLKTHTGAKKRFKLTKTGKIKRAHAYKSHLLNNAGNHPEMNDKAKALAEELDLACTAGSDGHGTDTAGRAGIAARERIRTNEDLVRVLKSRDYEIIRGV